MKSLAYGLRANKSNQKPIVCAGGVSDSPGGKARLPISRDPARGFVEAEQMKPIFYPHDAVLPPLPRDIVIRNRVADLASALRAECWPQLDAIKAVRVAVRFIAVLKDIERLKKELGVKDKSGYRTEIASRVLH